MPNELGIGERFLFGALTDGTITGVDAGEVYAELADQDADDTCVVFSLVSGPRGLTMGGEVITASPLYLVRVYGRHDTATLGTLRAAANDVETALLAASGAAYDGYTVVCHPDVRGLDQGSEVAHGVRYNHRGAFYRLFISQS